MVALKVVAAAAVSAVVVAGVVYWEFDNLIPIVGRGVNYVRFLDAPKGTLITEHGNAKSLGETKQPDSVRAVPVQVQTADAANSAKDWPSYNRTITSERFSALDQITKDNARSLSVLCTYDTGQYTGFNSGLLEIEGALVFSTEYDIFSIDPNTCKENWRVHETYTPATPQGVSRGPAFYDNMLFRGTQDGRVLAYDFKTGKKYGTLVSPTQKEARAYQPRRSSGTGLSSSAMPAAI